MSERKSWSKRLSGPEGSKSIEVREALNGYIIRLTTEGKDKDGEWQYEEKEYISKTNPFNKENENLPEVEDDFGEFLKEM